MRRRREPVLGALSFTRGEWQGRGVTLVNADDVRSAAQILDGVVHTTPIQTSEAYSRLLGASVVLKCEHLQRTGSFKVRGALVRLARLSEAERAAGVVAASAGNHAQGVAWSATRLGIASTVYMRSEAAIPKVEATRSYGAQVILGGANVQEALERAVDEVGERTFVHPFDHADVVAGQGTVGLEILQQVPDVGTIVVPTGGGGLLAGIIAAVPPHVTVIGVQAERANGYPVSLEQGHPVLSVTHRTMADGIAVGLPGQVPFEVIAARGSRVVTVSEDDLSRAVLSLAERAKQVVEPAGAAGVAALVGGELAGLIDPSRPVVVVLSGGNVDPIVLRKVFRHGMTAAGRYLHLRVLLSDRPGALARLLTLVADHGADVVTVAHVRTGVGLGVDETAVDLEVVTKGNAHGQDLLARLRDQGYHALER